METISNAQREQVEIANEIDTLEFRQPYHFSEYTDRELRVVGKKLKTIVDQEAPADCLDQEMTLGHVAFELWYRTQDRYKA